MIIEVFTAYSGGRYWRRLLEEWQIAGHTVREVYAVDDAAYRRTRGNLGRLSLRLRAYVIFPLRVWFRLRFGASSPNAVRVVVTSPFFLPFIVVWAQSGNRKAPIVNILNDLFPDALIHAGMLKPGGWPARWLGKMIRYEFKKCEATVFIGSHLMVYAERTYGRATGGQIIPVGADSRFVSDTLPAPVSEAEPVRILYSGNMGYMHDIDTALEAAKLGLPPGIHLTFHSSGVGYRRLARALAGVVNGTINQISLLGPLSEQKWREALSTYPIGLVTLKQGAQHVSMPSKTYSALAAGQAILAVCPPDSDLADLILMHDCGWIVQPGQVEELRSLLARISKHPQEVHNKRIKAFRAGHSLYDMAVISEQYLHLFAVLLKNQENALDRTAKSN